MFFRNRSMWKTRTVKNIGFLVRGRRLQLGLLFLAAFCVSLFDAVGIGSIYPIINAIQNPEKVSSYYEKLNSFLPFAIDSSMLIPLLIITTMMVFTVKNLFVALLIHFQAKFSENLTAEWKKEVFEVYVSKPYAFFLDNQAGELVQKMMIQTDNTTGMIMGMLNLTRMALTALAIYIVMCILSLQIAIVVTVIICIVIFISFKVSELVVFKRGQEYIRLQQEGFALATEAISGIRQVKAFATETHFVNRFGGISRDYAVARAKVLSIKGLPAPILETLGVVGVMALFLFITQFAENKGDIMATLAVFAGGAFRMIPTLSGLSSSFMAIVSQLPSVNTIADLLRQKVEIEDAVQNIPFDNELCLENVDFEYIKGRRVLNNVQMRFGKGNFIGIAGPSGSGKSTVADLLIGFVEPLHGKITVDGEDLKELDIRNWRKTIAVISQDTFIFSGTIAENISFALDERRIDEEKLQKASRMADAFEFIEKLANGYGTLVGERGMKLSGGQRQRLAIARAVYRDPEILLFDEATSSLDSISERKVQKAIEILSKNKTVIVIAHRLSTILNADHIYVMNSGCIVGQGTHKELRNNVGGLYATLCEKQGL